MTIRFVLSWWNILTGMMKGIHYYLDNETQNKSHKTMIKSDTGV